ncbi:MAG: hypothetical protein AAF485_22200 [Chloroflexota bacterium]
MESTILPAKEFDQGTTTASPDIQTYMQAMCDEAKAHGFDPDGLLSRAQAITSRQDADVMVEALHEAATLFFLQWKKARQEKQPVKALAIARLFNGITYQTRDLHKRFDLFETDHLKTLETTLKRRQNYIDTSPERFIDAIEQAAQAHTHERAWPWVVLPTFARQPYGRILLLKIDLEAFDECIFVTQPFFLEGECTLYHTHGQNWAVSRPLGNAHNQNTHINTLWLPRQPEKPFPLVKIDTAEYDSSEAVLVPPRIIHGIEKQASQPLDIPTLSELLIDQQLKTKMIEQTRFGELSCLHVYCPHLSLAKTLADSPIVRDDERFFIENDMIVFDHQAETIWSGGGGSWPRRMIEYGTTGEHCGMCFEDDPRKENLDPVMIAEWFIQVPAPQIVKYKQATA